MISVYKISYEGCFYYTQEIEEVLTELETAFTNKELIEVRVEQMDYTEFNSLPEFGGW